MTCLIEVHGDAFASFKTPLYLKSADPNANGGLGEIGFTPLQHEAKRFKDMKEAFESWREQSTVRPLRPDGKPNRPLTAYTIQFVNVDNGGDGKMV